MARQFRDDPRLAAVARDIELAFQKFRIRVTGVQASDKEIRMLRQVIAKLTDEPGVFFETVRNFMESANEDFTILLDQKEASNRDVSKFRDLVKKAPSVQKSGIRKEDKNIWERRVPLIPDHIKLLKDKYEIDFVVQPFENRVFSDKEFKQAFHD